MTVQGGTANTSCVLLLVSRMVGYKWVAMATLIWVDGDETENRLFVGQRTRDESSQRQKDHYHTGQREEMMPQTHWHLGGEKAAHSSCPPTFFLLSCFFGGVLQLFALSEADHGQMTDCAVVQVIPLIASSVTHAPVSARRGPLMSSDRMGELHVRIRERQGADAMAEFARENNINANAEAALRSCHTRCSNVCCWTGQGAPRKIRRRC